MNKKEKYNPVFSSLRSLPKFFTKKISNNFSGKSNSSSVCTTPKLQRPSICTLATPEKSFEDELDEDLDDKNAYAEVENVYDNLDVSTLDSLIANLLISRNNLKVKPETVEVSSSCLKNIGYI